MNRILILVASFFLLAGTVVGSIAHALEPGDEMQGISLSSDVSEAYSAQKPSFEKFNQSSSDEGSLPGKYADCHGHHVGIAIDAAAADNDSLHRDEVPCLVMAKLPLSAFIGTFRPPIA